MDSRLRDGLRAAAAPAEVGEADRARMRAAVAAARHRRSVRAVVAGAVAAVLLVAVAGALLRTTGAEERPRPSAPVPTDDWRPIAPSPLGGRAHPVGVWTGTELVVAGGEEGDICPPLADCLRPGTPSAGAAAYDPETDTWRALPPAPEAFGSGFGAWLGDRALFVSSTSATLLLDPDTGTWTRAASLPGQVSEGGLVVAGDDAVRYSYASRGDGPVDYRFDAATGTWAALPRDPFGESYDRSIAWLDGRLWLLSMVVENHADAYRGRPSRLAVLEGDRWRVVDPATPALTQGQRLTAQDGLLVVAENRDEAGRSRAYDPATGRWRELSLPATQASGRGSGCALGDAAAGPAWITAGDRLVSGAPADALAVPDCPGHAAYALVVWAGDRLVLWGGVATNTSSTATDAGEVWVPRPPG